jgi:two-component system CheB/CheR fusion protein
MVKIEDVQRSLPGGTAQLFDVQITPLIENGALLGVSIIFEDKTIRHQLQVEVQRHQQELETAYEELQSTNEELETTNEELQSSNEELETMNEELQSTNEELSTINEELRQRTEELNQTNTFLHSILGGLNAGVVVLDSKENIVSWNYTAEDLWGLRVEEVYGRSLLSLDIGLPVEKVKVAIRPCLTGESDHEEVALDAVNRRGKTIKCRVACTPIIGASKERQGTILMMEEMDSENKK